ncbi:hypothetical protein M9H77_00330 [Catharanthus roseus]|nr:hypothetical protein M9H77_00330 [Catharanthus roseus]
MGIKKLCIISKSIIKPSSPTPNHLKIYNISLMDQIAPHFYIPIVIFYRKLSCFQNYWNSYGITSRLKKSLSNTLTQYYPFAGRFNGKDSIDCNDEGLEFSQARIDCEIDDVLKRPDPTTMDLFSSPVVAGPLFNQSLQSSPFNVQVTHFTCGGMAISGSVLHKIGDASTVFGFLNDWATVACGGKASPTFIPPLISPFLGQITFPQIQIDEENIVTRKRFTFDASKINELKAIAIASGIDNPSPAEVVSALIYRSLAKEKSGVSNSRPSVLIHTVNLRPWVVPPLEENSVGNFSWFFSIISKDESERKLGTIFGAMKKEKAEFIEKFGKGLTREECFLRLSQSIQAEMKKDLRRGIDIGIYKCSFLFRFPFGETDFGWGNPDFVSSSFCTPLKNTYHLQDSMESEGGIDAVVSLEEQEMNLFENDEELLKFAAKIPTH